MSSPPAAAAPPSLPPTRITVLISGAGTNLRALAAALPHALPSASIARVISNRRAAGGLAHASAAGIATAVHALRPYKARFPATDDGVRAAREAYDADLAALVLADAPHLVVCAGWMHILSAAFLARLAAARVPVVNLHPALPGAFDGADAIRRAWEAGGDETGVMVHYVVPEVDRGEALIVRRVGLREGESLEILEERMHAVEWEVIVEGTRLAVERLWGARGCHGDEQSAGEVGQRRGPDAVTKNDWPAMRGNDEVLIPR
ncbi:MAG: hypothetical protein M1832_002762 [Thelocarpon impressellum]|nr:MAG: hypothetical protein M1832_002762 [Thelocarpon impressellum]